MFDTLWERLTSFRRDAHGVVLILTALLILPFIVLLGVAVDVGHLLVVKNQLIAAVDAAALSAAKNPTLTDAQAQAQVQAFINANFSSQNQISVSNLTINRTNNNMQVDVTATATVNTYFAEVIGYDTLSTTIHSQALGTQNHLEVVLVLDNTGSMSSMYGATTGIDGLKNAATTLVNTLFANDPTRQYVKIGVVPFTDTVNVGTQYATAAWIDNSNAAGSMSQENIAVPDGAGLITFADNLASATGRSSWKWGGCVRARTEPYDTEDAAPSAGAPATLFTPFFAPDEPDNDSSQASEHNVCGGGSGFFNSYLCDGSCWQSGQQADQQCVTKYTTTPQVQDRSNGPNNLCTIQPIIRLTNDQVAILNEINAMTAYGATVIPAGLIWGWHLLSPNGPFADGVAYTDTATVKAIILVTDGFNNVQLQGNGVPTHTDNGFNKSIYNAYGYGSGPHLNLLAVPNGVNEDQPDYNLDQKLMTLCNNIKAVTDASGNPGRIVVYAIGFGNSINNHGLDLLQQCASSASTYFYNPTSDDLNTTFQNIAAGLNKLRLSR
jgi:Flp pilus assembly protein TadG